MKVPTIRKSITNSLQVIAVLMMLLHHTFGFPDRLLDNISYIGFFIGGGYIEEFIGKMCKICVSLFAFISGYGFAQKGQWTWKYIIYKIINLTVIYWMTLLMFLVCYLIDGKLFRLEHILLNFLFIRNDLNHAAWYISFYFLSLLTIGFWKKYAYSRKKLIGIIMLFWGVNFILTITKTSVSNSIATYIVYMPVMLIGYYCGASDGFNSIYNKLINKRKWILPSFLFLCIILGLRVITGSAFIGFRFVWIYSAPICLILSVLLTYISKVDLIRKLFDFFGKYTTLFWLLNAIFTSGIYWIQKICFAPNFSLLILLWEIILLIVLSTPILLLSRGLLCTTKGPH